MKNNFRRALGAVLLLGATLLAAGCYKAPGEFLLASEAESIPYNGTQVNLLGRKVTFSKVPDSNDYNFTSSGKDGKASSGTARFSNIKGNFYVAQTLDNEGRYSMFIFRITDREMKMSSFKDENAVKAEATRLGLEYSSDLGASNEGYTRGFSGSADAMHDFVRGMSQFEYAGSNR